MKPMQILLFLLLSGIKLKADTDNSIEKFLATMKPEIYQDIIINGQIVKEGVKNCDQREPYIEALLNKYNRPFTILDIGASQGYFSIKIAQKYPHAHAIMIEGDATNQLPEICKRNTVLHNLVVLEKFITVEQLEQLAQCEHFDVVFAFNVIHHFKDKWQQAADAILRLGDHILIETPPIGCHTAANSPIIPRIVEYLDSNESGKVIGKVPRYGRLGLPGPDQKYANFYLFEMHKNILEKSTWGSTHLRYYPIISTFNEKNIFKPRLNKIIPWKPGINLWTFKHLHGTYPDPRVIENEIKRLAQIPHGDFVPWNIIIQGNALDLIDYEEENFPEGINNANLCLALLKR